MSNKRFGALIGSVLALGVVSPGAGAVATDPPPTLDGEYVFLSSAGGPDLLGFTEDCSPSGTSTLAFDAASIPPELRFQYLPYVGFFDPEPNPFPRDMPYLGPVELSVNATLGAHSLEPMALDFTTGWYNEQQGTRGLAAAPVESLTGTFRVVDGDVSVEALLLLPSSSSSSGSCYDDLAGAQLDVGSALVSGRQLRVRALDLAYEAVITTSNGTFRDEGTLVLSLREEVGQFVQGSFSGYGVEARFSSSLEQVEPLVVPLPPIAVDDDASAMVGEEIDIDVLENDSDADGDLDETTLTITSGPTLGAAIVESDTEGTTISYVASAAGTDSLTYQVCDATGLCASAVVTITNIAPSSCTITGTSGPDTLTGTQHDDIICGLEGNDTIDSRGGNDLVFGGPGDDWIDGGNGDDVIRAGRGADTLFGANGNDLLRGGRGADTLYGGNGDDRIHGGRGHDTLHGDRGDDELRGGRGHDTGNGGPGVDRARNVEIVANAEL